MAAAGDGDLIGDDANGHDVDLDGVHGHFFCKKTFHRPTYCHHCTDILWGLIGQGYMCEGDSRSSIMPMHRCTANGRTASIRNPEAFFLNIGLTIFTETTLKFTKHTLLKTQKSFILAPLKTFV